LESVLPTASLGRVAALLGKSKAEEFRDDAKGVV
jgi:hypothetical protein